MSATTSWSTCGAWRRLPARLKALGEHPLVGEARCVGLIGALELFADSAASKARFKLAGGAPATLAPRAPRRRADQQQRIVDLCATAGDRGIQINAIFDALARALDKTEAWARKEGHLS